MYTFISILVPSLSLVCYIFLLSIVYKSRDDEIVRSFIYFLLTVIIWSTGSLFMRLNLPPSLMFWNRVLCTGLTIMPIGFYNFILKYTRKSRKAITIFAVIITFIILVMNFHGLVVKEIAVVDDKLVYEVGIGAVLLSIFSIGIIVITFSIVFSNVKKKKLSFNEVKLILIGLTLINIGCICNVIPVLGTYPIDIFMSTISAVLIGLSIFKNRFLNIHLIVKRGLFYSAYTIALTLIYLFVISLVNTLLTDNIRYSSVSTSFVVALIMSFALQPTRDVLEKWINKFYFKDAITKREALNKFSKKINNILDIDELSNLLFTAITTAFDVDYLSLMVKDDNKYSIVSSTKNNYHPIEFDLNHPIVKWLTKEKSELYKYRLLTHSFFSSLWKSEKELIKQENYEIFFPILQRERLIGILLLKYRSDNTIYREEDMDIMHSLLNSTAVAIENAVLYKSAIDDSYIDALTGLHNHRYFEEQIRVSADKGDVDKYSLLFIDIDIFKSYNDLYGHMAGDNAIKHIADVLKQHGTAIRMGGEEFVIYLPDKGEHEAYVIGENIRENVEKTFSGNSDSDLRGFLTVSIGISHKRSKDKYTMGDMLKNADLALYSAKRKGKNRCIIYNQTQISPMYNKQNDFGIFEAQSTPLHELNETAFDFENLYFKAVLSMAESIDHKDNYTYGHSKNVSALGGKLAKLLNLDSSMIEIVELSGILHDIGKIGVPEEILTKTTFLTDEEIQTMRKHVDYSTYFMKHMPGLVRFIPAVVSHHERYDGKGYPRGIKGEGIPLEGRVLSVVDAFESMISDRPYRKALSLSTALGELEKHSGTQFDAELAAVFINGVKNCNIELEELVGCEKAKIAQKNKKF